MTVKKILFVNDEMEMGGVARVLNTLMAALPKDRYEIDLLVLHPRGMLLEEVPEGVRVISGTPFFRSVDRTLNELVRSGNWSDLAAKLRLLFFMKSGLIKKKIISERKKILDRQYDVEVAAKEGFCTIFTAYGDSLRKINWVLTDYSVRNYSSNHMALVKQALARIDLNIADSEKALIAYETVFRVQNGVSIHNLMDLSVLEKAEQEEAVTVRDSEDPNVITVARFHPQKGLERLIQASWDALQAGLNHTLYLVGGGELEGELKEQVRSLGMNNVVFCGYSSNPYADIRRCDLFVLSSYYEGFATVNSESLIVGTPVLTTQVSGCEEQITDPSYGWIVENSQAGLSNGLITALRDREGLKKRKEALKNYRYDNREVLEKFMEVL